MSTSSKHCEATNKVVVVNSNDFYALKKIKQQKKEQLSNAKRNQAVSHASFISKVCSQSVASTSSWHNPQASTSSKITHQDIAHTTTSTYHRASTTSKSSICKLVSKKHVVARTESCKSAQKKKSTRNIPIIEKDMAKIIFPNLSKATETEDETFSVAKISQNQSILIDENMSEEKVIELISKRYGKALESQISLLQEHTGTESMTIPLYVDTTLRPAQENRATVSTSPIDVDAYKLKEEQFLNKLDSELNNSDEIENAKSHLETIVILDSPREDYQVLSRKELKNLPDKIFASPPQPTIKLEIQSPKEEDITKGSSEDLNIKPVSHLQNLGNKNDGDETVLDFSSKRSLSMTAAQSSNLIRKKEGYDVGKIGFYNKRNNAANGKNFWELEQKDLNFEVLIDDEKPDDESDEKIKKIVISDEDVVIFKEMDQFIEDIELKNTSSRNGRSDKELPVVTKHIEEHLIPKSTNVEGNKGNLDPQYETEDLSPTDRLKEFDDIVRQKMIRNHIETTMSLDETEDQLIFEIVKKFDKGNQNGPSLISPRKFSDTTFKVPEEKRGTVEESLERESEQDKEVKSSMKDDILEKLVTETGIEEYADQTTEESEKIMATKQPNLKEGEVSKESVQVKDDKNSLGSFASENLSDRENKLEMLQYAGNHNSNEFKEIEGEGLEYVLVNGDHSPVDPFAAENMSNKSKEILNSANPNPVEVCKENENNLNHYKLSEHSSDICHSSTCERTSSSEYQILIIKEDGFLEPLNPDVSRPASDLKISNGNDESRPDQSGLNEEKGIYNGGIHKEEILALLEKAKSIKFEVIAEGSTIEKLKSFSRSLRDQIRILNQLYGKLEIFAESTGRHLDRNLKAEEVCALQATLNFIKGVIEKTFSTEEKKLKFKVISITKKTTDQVKSSASTKPVTKKVYERSVPRTARKQSNKLLRRTLFRMNRLMVALERNRALLLSARQQAFVSKLKQMAKGDSKGRKTVKVSDASSFSDAENSNATESSSSETNKVADQDPATENDETNEPVALNCENRKRSDSGILSEKENDLLACLQPTQTDGEKGVHVQSPVKIQAPSDSAIPKVGKKKRGPKPKRKTEEKQLGNGRRLSKRLKKIFKPKHLGSGRYFLRSHTESGTDTDLDNSKQSGEEASQTKNRPSYEVIYSKVLPLDKIGRHNFDYDLENDSKPSVVLRRTSLKSKPIFEETFNEFQNRNIGYLLKDGSIRRRPGTNRYEMRSRTQEQMVLRSRKT